jgi:hypothetical protein
MRLMWHGLGLMMAGAVLHGSLAAQVRDTIPKRPDSTKIAVPVPAGADSLLRDSLAKIAARDSARKAFEAGDTIKSPMARAEQPIDLGIARRLHWNRDSLFATGALTVADLLERVTGMTTLHGGWIAAPAIGSYLGDTRRVRFFYDGYEYLPLDPRGNDALDLTQINLWSAEELTIEQGPEEIRIYLRSWRMTSTTPETRTDIGTGDQATNLYRGFFGRRFRNGLALQFAAQQYGTTPPSILGGSSDQTGVIARVGWSNPKWSLDAFMNRIGRHRGTLNRTFESANVLSQTDSVPSVESTRSEYYLRLGYRDPDTSAVWLQAMAVASKYDYTGTRTLAISNPTTPGDSAFNETSLDTATSRAQYILTAGTTRGPLRLSATERVIAGTGRTFNVPSVRASFGHALGSATLFAEGKGIDSSARIDLTAQFTPLSFVSILGSVGRAKDDRIADSSFSTNYARVEAGLRVKNLWLLAGAIHRDSVRLAAPTIFNAVHSDSAFVPVNDLSATGATVAIRGRLWKFIQADAQAIRWNDTTGFYRPRFQTRSELFVKSNMLERFPSGDLGIMASVVHEYRSGTRYPTATDISTVPGYRTISWQLEIRILSATVSWQFRNLLGERYRQVPGLLMPRQTNFYGVRWTFFD